MPLLPNAVHQNDRLERGRRLGRRQRDRGCRSWHQAGAARIPRGVVRLDDAGGGTRNLRPLDRATLSLDQGIHGDVAGPHAATAASRARAGMARCAGDQPDAARRVCRVSVAAVLLGFFCVFRSSPWRSSTAGAAIPLNRGKFFGSLSLGKQSSSVPPLSQYGTGSDGAGRCGFPCSGSTGRWGCLQRRRHCTSCSLRPVPG